MIPERITIKDGALPPSPGVYLMKDGKGRLLYIGKATSLRSRVSSYFTRPADERIAMMVARIREIDWVQTPTAIEALLLESKLIKKHQPPFNVKDKDDRSWVYLAFTKDDYPQPVLIRGHELARVSKRKFLKVFGPFRSAASVRSALEALRKAFPWSTCRPGRGRPCLYRHIGKCPGVCTGDITPEAYRLIIDRLMAFFEGKRSAVIKGMEAMMRKASEEHRFEDAASLRDQLYALDHVRDIAVLKKEDAALDSFIDVFGRIEGYDISNIGGKDAVGSMVVFKDGEPRKSSYRKFRIRTVDGANDTAMLAEVFTRRFAHSVRPEKGKRAWPLPDLILVDGGVGQMNAARVVLERYGLTIPMVGIAKGFDRKQDELVFDKGDTELARLVRAFKPLLQQVRDEAHRFAVSYHRKRRGKGFLKK